MSRQLTLFHSIQLNQGDGGSSSSTVIEPDASDCPSSTNPHGVESTTVSSNVGSNESCSVEEEESLNIDIASGPHENPVQPINHPFPFTMISKKARCFNAKWYQQYEWIQYSIAKDAVFCYSCCLFCHASNKAEDCFVTLGFRDWKHASRKGRAFAKHDTSKSHQEALMNWNQFKVTVATGSSIATRLDSARKEQIKKNRHYLIAIIHSLMYCASQEIALRGHRETPSVSNQGNFLELVKLLAMYDPIIHDRLTSGPQNALYTSHSIQNQLLHILGEKIRNSICHQVRSAGVFIILADETKDFSKQEQMCFVVRYADMAQDYSKIVSQGYDGASVIEWYMRWCPSQMDSCRSVASASEFFAFLEALYVFMASSKAHAVFIEVQKKNNPDKQPKIGSSSDQSKAVEAKGLLFQVQSFSFLLSLVIFDRILSCTKQLSDQLQSSKIDLYRASELVTASKVMLQQFRTDEYWDQIFRYATDIANTHSISTEVDEPRSTRKQRPANLDDSIITDSVGSREPMKTSHFKTRLYFPVLDQFLVEMNARFNQSNCIILKGIATCSPSSSVFLDFQDMKEFALMFGIDVTTLVMEVALASRVASRNSIKTTVDLGRYLHSCLPVHRNLYDTIQIAFTNAVSSAECEHSSSLKRIKTRLRTTMGEDRLSDLAILFIERDMASKTLDYEQIIDEFASADKNQ
ncbi:PREDICTED: uncharacterized protein LOC100633168 [Amphimedon queenslandica]|uniref:TTF-type domain-containing protein n=2 Tax=Amphimedon queenslandica TaxID=400682 RepID=A0AAN0IKM9_AMPQE|nr:PREDICTED: uncharacterized protein LOC100633168 [Amphimedon queenslandica]|eukprot:XP_011403202.1 PREDICTED: uncharacterized protein LOC100633168 [Amphimedon queenslandica]